MNVPFLSTIIILVAILLIISSLAVGLFYLLKDKSQTNRTVNALAIRIGLSLFLFFALWYAYIMGWIAPHSL